MYVSQDSDAFCFCCISLPLNFPSASTVHCESNHGAAIRQECNIAWLISGGEGGMVQNVAVAVRYDDSSIPLVTVK